MKLNKLVICLCSSFLLLVSCSHTAVNKKSQRIDLPEEDVVSVDVAYIVDNGSDIWQRLRDGFSMPELNTNEVRNQERLYLSNPKRIENLIERSNKYIYYVLEQIEQQELPTELVILPFVESAFNPLAVSPAKASGMWQFMPKTGQHYNLVQNSLRDERRDIVASTDAALKYLSYLHDFLGDWHLALAGYNWGEGSVQRAVNNNIKQNKPTGYTDLRMPRETQQYVPRLQALKNIINDPEKYGISLPDIKNEAYFVKVKINHDIDIDLAAKLAEISIGEFKDLNPAFSKPVIFAKGTPQILIPSENLSIFTKNLKDYLHDKRGPLASWTIWLLPKNMTVTEVASSLSLPEQEIRQVNNIVTNGKIVAGSALLIHRSLNSKSNVAGKLVNSYSLKLQIVNAVQTQNFQTIRVRVRLGDTLGKIAQRNRVKVQDIARWNRINIKKPLYIGQTLILHTSSRSYAKTKITTVSKQSPRISNAQIIVKPGDSISAIAQKYKVSSSDLMKWNQLKTSKQLRAGQKLNIYSSKQSSSSSNKVYTVKSGDTLGTISKNYSASVANLMRWNNLTSPKNLRVGQQLKLYPQQITKYYLVKAGDSLGIIAKRNNTSVARIMQINKMKKVNELKAGKKILLP